MTPPENTTEDVCLNQILEKSWNSLGVPLFIFLLDIEITLSSIKVYHERSS